jgi:hypothetical protein
MRWIGWCPGACWCRSKADGKPEWNGESSDGIRLCVRGSEEGPDPVAIQQAKAIVDALGEYAGRLSRWPTAS